MPELFVGVGFTQSATVVDVVTAVRAVAPEGNSIAGLATVTSKAASPVLIAAADMLSIPIIAFEPEVLAAVTVPSPSWRVEQMAGTPSVAEAAAILAADHGQLIVRKTSTDAVTVAAARKVLPACTTIQK
ncbi:cobalamin biosynthesis protein [Rhodococcus sp. ARC_M6]|uniref:cobalamin biosynthesis protein n=1 Tax=Rhodococcus sp. ARC_M6 TaxID=2928852 RepID=UPI001FB34D4D|nr:cobalamin biosynthesis protein [Rhodococcus sp. ARC_M6]MCJ0905710.1 cobalamin biosynthesis protein [Rhodococcus sp. ARC_M6]